MFPSSFPSSLSPAPDSLSSAPAPTSAAEVVVPAEHLTFEAPDSVLGAYFAVRPAPLQPPAAPPSPLAAGTFPLPKDSIFLAGFRTLWQPDVRDICWRHEEVEWHPVGIAGDPVEYRFRNDDYVTAGLLFNFFLIALVVATSWRFLRGQLADFFYTRERPNLFNNREDNVLRGRFFLVLQTCFMVGILFFGNVQAFLPQTFAAQSPYVILGVGTGIMAVYFLFKLLLYAIVNHTFFTSAKCRQWSDMYLISVFATGCGLMPLALALVFFDLPVSDTLIAGILLLSLVKILLLYKCYHIFFQRPFGVTHLILYFCALEITPVALVGATLYGVGYALGL